MKQRPAASVYFLGGDLRVFEIYRDINHKFLFL
jgi:hypothetical protein